MFKSIRQFKMESNMVHTSEIILFIIEVGMLRCKTQNKIKKWLPKTKSFFHSSTTLLQNNVVEF